MYFEGIRFCILPLPAHSRKRMEEIVSISISHVESGKTWFRTAWI